MIKTIREELRLRSDFFASAVVVDTIYFGGGTPSILEETELMDILNDINKYFKVSKDAEITLEANPDDLNSQKLSDFKRAGINRLSIGIQSFNNDVLQWMNRSHNAEQSINSVKNAIDVGFNNITADLIFGLPGRGESYWSGQLEKAVGLGINHLSVYSLTVEEKTVLHHQISKGILPNIVAEEQADQFMMAEQFLTDEGFEHYEISNYAKPGYRSKHNSSYWKGYPYLGIGPSAHSFDGNNARSWNVANNHIYMQGTEEGKIPQEKEQLETRDRINEFILTRLRTSEGLPLKECKALFDYTIEEDQFRQWTDTNKLVLKNQTLLLTNEGKLIADAIASSLFIL